MCLFILKLNYQLSLKTSFQNKYLIFSFILSVLVFFLPLNIPQFRMENWNNIKKVEKSYTKICLLKIGWIYQLHQIKTFSNVTSIKTTTKKIKTNNTNNTFNIQKCIMVTRPQVVDVSLLRLSPTVEVCAIAPEKRANTFLSDSSLWHGGGAKEKQQDPTQLHLCTCTFKRGYVAGLSYEALQTG